MDFESFQQSDPKLCDNGCGFFGTAATMNLCSKCYRDLRVKEKEAVYAESAMAKLVDDVMLKSRVGSPSVADAAVEVESVGQALTKKRCRSCKKKVGLLGFRCRCGSTFCGTHRYPESHECEVDFQAAGREAIGRDNPVVKPDKVERF